MARKIPPTKIRITMQHVHEHLLNIGSQLNQILKQNRKFMATLAQVQQALTDLQASVDAKQQQIIDEIKALKDQIASGGTVTEADLDGLLTTVEGIKTDIDTTDLG